ncbi:MAG TPA: SMC-Scp complex subunit ScpB [Rubrobacteraceae bacterium]|nr:SMC-Scp complex subunit ScpB [Rubrobacteraceae bacterium]
MSDPSSTARIEAVLLVSPSPVSPAILKSATGLSDTELHGAIVLLGERYSRETSGIVLRQVAGGYQLATNPDCASVVERFREESRPAPLSSAAHEVLSCALYLGPLTRAGISAARGVNSDAVIRGLIERGLLHETGTDRGSPGTPALLDITDEFLAAAGATARQDFMPLDSLVGSEELARVRERVGAAEPEAEQPTSPQEER